MSTDIDTSGGKEPAKSQGTDSASVVRYRILELAGPEAEAAPFGVAFESGDAVRLWYPPLRGPVRCQPSSVDGLTEEDIPLERPACRWSSAMEWRKERQGPFSPMRALGMPVAAAKTAASTSATQSQPEDRGEMGMSTASQPKTQGVYVERAAQYLAEKRCIAEYVAWWLRTNYTAAAIAIDGGTTNEHIVTAICRDARKIPPTVGTIISNSVAVLRTMGKLIRDGEQPQTVAIGGELRGSHWTLVGPDAVKALEEKLFGVAIVGANGFDPPVLATNTTQEHQVKLEMLRGATHVIFPLDAFKWGGRHAASALVPLDRLATDERKRVYLVTCYPKQGQEESLGDYDRRLGRFKECSAQLIQTWIDKYGPEGIRAVCSRIVLPEDPLSLPPEEHTHRVYDGEQLGGVDFFKKFIDQLPWDRTQADVGLTIAIELCAPKSVAG
ncbi:MAG: hypothetical protein ABIK89_04190 [Planctomycetota bacterium]